MYEIFAIEYCVLHFKMDILKNTVLLCPVLLVRGKFKKKKFCLLHKSKEQYSVFSAHFIHSRIAELLLKPEPSF